MGEDSRESGVKGHARRGLLKALGLVAGVGVFGTGVRLAISDGSRAEEDFRRGLELYREGRYEEAVDLFGSVAAARPQDPLPRILTGLAYANWGRYQAAAASFSQTLELDPDSAVVHLYRGEALLQMWHETEARQDFEAARALAAGDERVVSAASARLRSLEAGSLPKDVTR